MRIFLPIYRDKRRNFWMQMFKNLKKDLTLTLSLLNMGCYKATPRSDGLTAGTLLTLYFEYPQYETIGMSQDRAFNTVLSEE